MQQNDIEKKLWEYIDGVLNASEQKEINALIATDAVWKETYQQLLLMHEMLHEENILEHPSMRFTQNIMDVVAIIQPATRITTLSKNWFVRSFAVFFIVVTLFCVAVLSFSGTNSEATPGKHQFFTGIFNHVDSTTLYIAALVNCVVLLILADKYLTYRKQLTMNN